MTKKETVASGCHFCVHFQGGECKSGGVLHMGLR